MAATAPPRLLFAEYPRGSRGAAATSLHGISTSTRVRDARELDNDVVEGATGRERLHLTRELARGRAAADAAVLELEQLHGRVVVLERELAPDRAAVEVDRRDVIHDDRDAPAGEVDAPRRRRDPSVDASCQRRDFASTPRPVRDSSASPRLVRERFRRRRGVAVIRPRFARVGAARL